MCSLLVNCFPVSQSLVTTDLFPIHITLSFHKCHIINSYNMWIFASSILLSAKWILDLFSWTLLLFTHTHTNICICMCVYCSTIFWIFFFWNGNYFSIEMTLHFGQKAIDCTGVSLFLVSSLYSFHLWLFFHQYLPWIL